MKNVIIYLSVFFLYIICAAVSCEKKESEICHTVIRFSNNSENDLYIRSVLGNKGHPITLELSYYHNTILTQYKVVSGEQNNRRATDNNTCYEHVFERNSTPDTLKFYVLDAYVVENTPWDIVARDYLVLKRYDLSLEDLQKLNWRVTYPPTEEMKDVEQYPPYGSE